MEEQTEVVHTIFNEQRNPLSPFKRVLTFTEACAFVELTPAALAEETYNGRIMAYRPRKNTLVYRRKDLEAWLLHLKYVPYSEINLPSVHCRYQAKERL